MVKCASGVLINSSRNLKGTACKKVNKIGTPRDDQITDYVNASEHACRTSAQPFSLSSWLIDPDVQSRVRASREEHTVPHPWGLFACVFKCPHRVPRTSNAQIAKEVSRALEGPKVTQFLLKDAFLPMSNIGMALKISTILIFLTGALWTYPVHADAMLEPSTIDRAYFYCRWGQLHVLQHRAFCVVASNPSPASYSLYGDSAGDYSDDLVKIVSNVKALTGSELRSASFPDLRLILSAHPQDEMNRMADQSSKYSSYVFNWGCPSGPMFTPRLGRRIEALIDLTNLAHDSAARCMEAAIYPYFGISNAEQFPISAWSWHAHDEASGSDCDKPPEHSLSFAIIPLVNKDKGLLFGRAPLVEMRKICWRWGGTTF